MGRQTTKAILSRDEISLIRNSEEAKSTELYGNLYETLLAIKNLKATTIDKLNDLNDGGIAALTYNKKSLIDNVKQEWYVESQSAEDPDKKVHCGLCNTPNKYLFYIRNRLNNNILNVGSHCMTKFPGIEGYTEHKYQLNQIQKNHKVVMRRTEFHAKFPTAINIIDSANFYFDNLPILLPDNIYYALNETITRLRIIYTRYVSSGKIPYENANPFDLFEFSIKEFNRLKLLSDFFIKYNINKPLKCKRQEIDWMIENKQTKILELISCNNGQYTKETLGMIFSLDFIKQNFVVFYNQNSTKKIQLIEPKNNVMHFRIELGGYYFLFIINIKQFMSQIGANCIFDKNFRYGEKELFLVSKIIDSYSNLSSAIDSMRDISENCGYYFLIDDYTKTVYIYKKNDKSVKSFSQAKFLELYSLHRIKNKMDIYKLIGTLTYKNWLSFEEQEKQGIDEKVNNLYYHEYIEPYQ